MATIGFRFLSWNLDNFGKFNYSGTMTRIAQTIIDSGAEIAVILEVYSQGTAQGSSKKVKIGDQLATAKAVSSVASLLSELQTLEPASQWTSKISGVNTGNKERDSYAYFWKTKTAGSALGSKLLPTDITLMSGPDMLLVDDEGKNLSGRRPSFCVFKLDNAAANPPTQNILVCAFHADATFEKPTVIMNSVKGCVKAANLESVLQDLPVVIGGDLNISYNTANKAFYDQLLDDFEFETALTDGTGSSLLANPNFAATTPKVANNAFDNFLYRDVDLLATPQAEVINVVEKIADALPQNDSKGKKRKRADLEKEAFSQYYTKDNSTTSAISDHFPIVGAFGF